MNDMQPLQACLVACKLCNCKWPGLSVITHYNSGIISGSVARNHLIVQYVKTIEATFHRVHCLPITTCSASDCT